MKQPIDTLALTPAVDCHSRLGFWQPRILSAWSRPLVFRNLLWRQTTLRTRAKAVERYVIRHRSAFQLIQLRRPLTQSSNTDDVNHQQILEEGKAFELGMSITTMGITCRDRYTDWLPAGNRWHIDCFRCNTCGTILDSDANLLLLGDGSLICNNCTYSCSVCGNKIEDLAILTGDQAFCANCFKCRNCKKKIENLKYARTSQGIFCMECHESLMQRRRKKSQKNSTNRHKHLQQPPNSTMLLDKSLPSLPPSAVSQNAFCPDSESPPSETYSETPTDLHHPSSLKRPSNSRTRSEASGPSDGVRAPLKRPPNLRSNSSRSDKRDRSPLAQEDERKGTNRLHLIYGES